MLTRRWVVFFSLCCASIPVVTVAQTIPLEVGIGTLGSVSEPYLQNYLIELYEFIVGSIGVISAVMIMFNGMRWASSAGNAENITQAKEGISSAVVGLVIALMSYVLLNAINPALVNLQDLEMEELEFVEPVTTSTAAMASGQISDDPSLYSYMSGTEAISSDLLAYLENQATEPHITKPTYDALVAALRLLKDDSRYSGMKLVIASANRSLDTQNRLWACYQTKKNTGTCPSSGCGSCNVAASPGKSNHGYGTALDVSWKNTGSGAYTTTTGYASSSWHKSCLVNNSASNCTTALVQSVTALNTMMQSAGFNRICIEWWHHQIGGSSGSLCNPGVYR